jgi:hypothetical protein
MLSVGWTPNPVDPCVFSRGEQRIVFHVDDGLLEFGVQAEIDEFIASVKDLGVKDLGVFSRGLGIQVEWGAQGAILHQTDYITKLLETYGFQDAHPSPIPMSTGVLSGKESKTLQDFKLSQVVGSVLFATVNTRLDVSFACSRVGQKVADPKPEDYSQGAKMLRYLNGTRDQGILFEYGGGNTVQVVGFADSDWAGDNDRRSQMGFIFLIGSAPIAWGSKKHKTIPMSSTEAELGAELLCFKEGMFIVNFLASFDPTIAIKPLTVYEDNDGARHLSKSNVFGKKTKHIDVQHRFINEAIENGVIDLQRVDSAKNPADIFTKALAREPFHYHVSRLLHSVSLLNPQPSTVDQDGASSDARKTPSRMATPRLHAGPGSESSKSLAPIIPSFSSPSLTTSTTVLSISTGSSTSARGGDY